MSSGCRTIAYEGFEGGSACLYQQTAEGVRIGVVAFSDNASITQAPSLDHDEVLAAINRLRPQQARQFFVREACE